MKNLNTNYHYDEFRINRFVMRTNKIPLDGANLADYLYNYSIEDDYPIKIKNIIMNDGAIILNQISCFYGLLGWIIG